MNEKIIFDVYCSNNFGRESVLSQAFSYLISYHFISI